MKLPNGKRAVVEIAKVRDYCLNVAHPEGRHKARVFRAVLGIGPAESHMLQDRLLAAALDQEAAAGEVDQFGHRYVIDFPLEHLDGGRWCVRLGSCSQMRTFRA